MYFDLPPGQVPEGRRLRALELASDLVHARIRALGSDSLAVAEKIDEVTVKIAGSFEIFLRGPTEQARES